VLAAVVAVALVVAALLLQRDPPETTAVGQTTAARTTAVRTTAAGTTAVGSTGPGQTTAVGQTVEPGRELLSLPAEGAWGSIHAADAPELCLTEGRDSTGAHNAVVAALRPCDAPGPRVLLQPVRGEFTTIKWEHPEDKGLGCLAVLRSGPAAHLLEPWDKCAEDNVDQLFRVEHVRDQRFLIRSAGGSACIGLRGGAVVEGAEAVREPCADKPDQEFTVELTP
jgi:hypothetical protein